MFNLIYNGLEYYFFKTKKYLDLKIVKNVISERIESTLSVRMFRTYVQLRQYFVER